MQSEEVAENRPNQEHRDQVADLLLLDSEGRDLFITSNIKNNPDRSFWFTTEAEGVKYKITIKVEAIEAGETAAST